MSAPDDKISSNRRRLFKALSTAPVVMTLKPGAALANASAYQCAGKIFNGSPELTALGPEPTADFVSLPYDYFVLTDIPAGCVIQPTASGEFVVYIDGALYRNTQPGVAVTAGFVYAPGAGEGTGTGTLTLLDGSNNSCKVISATAGHFALLDDVASDNVFTGVAYPKANPTMPNVQGITGTCLASINGLPVQQRLFTRG